MLLSMILIKHLSDGKCHPVSDLADLLSISTTSVSREIQKIISEFDVKCDFLEDKGYQIKGGVDLLDKNEILSLMSPELVGALSGIELQTIIDSTNSFILEKNYQGVVHSGFVCLSEKQTAGRGRLGRKWVSPFAKNIYLSIFWEFEGGLTALEGLSLAVAVAVARVLESLGVENISLKWPNDILIKNKKLAGILLELSGEPSENCGVVIGLGLNVSMDKSLTVDIDQDWLNLDSVSNEPFNRNELVAVLLEELLLMLKKFSISGFSSFYKDWLRLDAFLGKEVELLMGAVSEVGVIQGVDRANGMLKLRVGDAVKCFSGGEISLRLKQ
jgi:BirA family biotin operon repressor/biotin-[acetyl-CoA-carboxylase] ligase